MGAALENVDRGEDLVRYIEEEAGAKRAKGFKHRAPFLIDETVHYVILRGGRLSTYIANWNVALLSVPKLLTYITTRAYTYKNHP